MRHPYTTISASALNDIAAFCLRFGGKICKYLYLLCRRKIQRDVDSMTLLLSESSCQRVAFFCDSKLCLSPQVHTV